MVAALRVEYLTERSRSLLFGSMYGISNEPLAARRYEEVLHTMGHHVTVSTCGLLVNPEFLWLGASPDRIVFDPTELGYGVLEIKCPYSHP
ncbi:hypothetical protein HPB48_009902 [Haemaphysalis longicornis]|uniref:YqaJ viral recombinase domain-containing protein n=1 Tax=Haemaphysalis longicornis TaxID=44386 RepID=A0A9J6GBR3_HAELO|nr:hypothetical protein HPB48_009902 [Haemaphysalis longicornis]